MTIHLDIPSLFIGGVIGVILGIVIMAFMSVSEYDDFHWH